MKHGVISLCSALAAALVVTLAARADSKPDFDEDAKPILRAQPGLLQYVQSHFQVRDTGTAKFPGDDDHRPAPPFIFFARPAGSGGPYNLRLLIQPGPPGHILGVVDINKVREHPAAGGPQQPPAYTGEPGPGAPVPPAFSGEPPQSPALNGPAPASAPNPAYTGEPPAGSSAPAPPQPAAPLAPASSSSAPTADTPSGPIGSDSAPSSSPPSLAPPPDPAPNSQ